MSNAAELYPDPIREDVDYLLERSRQHERQLAEVREQSQQQFEDLMERLEEHHRQLAELCDKWLFATSSLREESRHIEDLTAGLKSLEQRVGRLADDIRAKAGKPKSAAARVREVLYWLGAGAAVVLLFSGIWLFSGLLWADSPRPGAWLLPTGVTALGVMAALFAGVLRP